MDGFEVAGRPNLGLLRANIWAGDSLSAKPSGSGFEVLDVKQEKEKPGQNLTKPGQAILEAG